MGRLDYAEQHQLREFVVTEQHVALLRRAYVWWNDMETGAPAIDPKRPYGNSDVAGDVREILGLEEQYPLDEEWGEMPDAAWDELMDIHFGTELALQVFLITGEMRPGRYVRDTPYDRDWVRADD